MKKAMERTICKEMANPDSLSGVIILAIIASLITAIMTIFSSTANAAIHSTGYASLTVPEEIYWQQRGKIFFDSDGGIAIMYADDPNHGIYISKQKLNKVIEDNKEYLNGEEILFHIISDEGETTGISFHFVRELFEILGE